MSADGEVSRGTVDRVSEKDLRTFNRDDLSEALALIPGVAESRTGARNERTVFVRGFDVKHVPLFMDGIIGWVGLLIPHSARMIVGPDNRILLPASALIGAIYLLIADDIARLLFRVEIPIGILTSLAGIPFFAFVLRKSKKKGWN